MSLLRVLILAVAFGCATILLGWWGVPVLGAVWGVVGRSTRYPAVTAAVAAATGWALILVWTAAVGPLARLVEVLGGIAGVPGAVFVTLTLVVPAMLAGLGAWVTAGIAAKSPAA